MISTSLIPLGATINNKTKSNRDLLDKLNNAKIEIVDFSSTSNVIRKHIQPQKKKPAKKLYIQVMFADGCDALNTQNQERLDSLASYLLKKPTLKVRLDGHADPRGTDEYNNVLALERAKCVSHALQDRDIEHERIQIFSHGANFASEIEATRNHYAFERRVHIEIYEP